MGSLSPSSCSSWVVVLALVKACALIFSGGLAPALAQTSCPVSLTSSNGTVKSFTKCTDLQNQGSTLSWSFQPPSDAANSNLGGIFDVAFRTRLTSSGGWAAWGINFDVPESMEGTNALIAFNADNGSNVLPYKLTTAVKNNGAPLVCSPIDLVVLASGVEIANTQEVTIFATVRLPPNLTVINQVWNRGSSVTNYRALTHAITRDTISAYGTLDFSSGAVTAGTVANHDLKNVSSTFFMVSPCPLDFLPLSPSGCVVLLWCKFCCGK